MKRNRLTSMAATNTKSRSHGFVRALRKQAVRILLDLHPYPTVGHQGVQQIPYRAGLLRAQIVYLAWLSLRDCQVVAVHDVSNVAEVTAHIQVAYLDHGVAQTCLGLGDLACEVGSNKT